MCLLSALSRGPFVYDDFARFTQNELLKRDAEALRIIFAARYPSLECRFHFSRKNLPYGMIWLVSERTKPTFIFGRAVDEPEKLATAHRLLQIFPLIEFTSMNTTLCDQIELTVGDAGGAGQVCFCSSSADAILVPDSEFLGSLGYTHARAIFLEQPEWSMRSDLPFWRGSTTGPSGVDLIDLPRSRLCLKSRSLGYDVAFSSVLQEKKTASLYTAGLVDKHVPWQHLVDHKYNIDIDGNTSAWSGLFVKLLAGGVVLKVASKYRQWFYDRLHPWYNYVPVEENLGDLEAAIQRLNSDQELAESIGRNGRQLALSLTFESEMKAAFDKIKEAAMH